MILMRMMMKHILSSHQIDFLVFNVKLSVSVDISVAWVAAVVDSMNNNITITITYRWHGQPLSSILLITIAR